MAVMLPALTVGPDPVHGRDWCSLADLLHGSAPRSDYADVVLQPRLDALGDLWPILAACHRVMAEDGLLTLHCRPHAGPGRPSVENLLWCTGFTGALWADRGAAVTARAVPLTREPLSCSIIIPCRNEVGNIEGLVRRTPSIGTHTELLFVDGDSTDGTPALIEQQIAQHAERDIRLLHQTGGGGKAAAVFQGFDAANGDVVMILDADMTVAPEDLPRFYDVIATGRGDFGNGTRFLYGMEADAMQPLNNAGNRLFCAYLSWLVGARITDTLCGTKSMRRADWQRIREVRPRFGGHDPWGDFDLLLGAACVGLTIRDIPIVYRARTAGESKMHAFSHGSELAKTCLAGLRALKLEGNTLRSH
jgi:hypothetical protein